VVPHNGSLLLVSRSEQGLQHLKPDPTAAQSPLLCVLNRIHLLLSLSLLLVLCHLQIEVTRYIVKESLKLPACLAKSVCCVELP
jgi:hypothetical protein